jgi:hypothetical protein
MLTCISIREEGDIFPPHGRHDAAREGFLSRIAPG